MSAYSSWPGEREYRAIVWALFASRLQVAHYSVLFYIQPIRNGRWQASAATEHSIMVTPADTRAAGMHVRSCERTYAY